MIKKKGDIERAMMYFLMIAILFVILIIGYKSISTFGNKKCDTEFNEILLDLTESSKVIMFREGAIKDKEYSILCDIKKVYFIDKKKNANADEFNDTPIIKDAILEKSDRNAFFLNSEGEIVQSLAMKEFELEYPYYLCFDIKNNKLNLLLEGRKGITRIKHKASMDNCGAIPYEPTPEQIVNVINNISSASPSGISNMNTQFGGELVISEKVEKTRPYINIYREVKIKSKKAEVKIKIRPSKKMKDLVYLENIPKDCMPLLSSYGITFDGEKTPSGDEYSDDPLIMWRFSGEVNERKKVSYKFSGDSENLEECLKIVESIVFASEINESVDIEYED